MKLSYKQKLFLYIFFIFWLFTLGIVVFERSQEKKYRTEALEEKLDAYTNIINAAFILGQDLDSLAIILPEDIRTTLINSEGIVQYDNVISDVAALENHAERPEVVESRAKSKGVHIRTSASNNKEYLYYAKNFNNYLIRVALPYDIKVQNFIKSDNLFLYYIIALFLAMLILINLVATRFGQSIKHLRDLILSSNDEINHVKFPQNELGEISEKIVENFNQLRINEKKIVQEREKLLQHVHISEEGICFFSENNTIEFYNGLFIQYLNIITDLASSEPEPSLMFADPVFSELNSFLASGKEQGSYFEKHIEKHSRHFSLRANVFDDMSFEVIINDITKQRKTSLLKQEMTGNIAHELRTPVTSIRGYLETIIDKKLTADKARQFLTKAYNQVLVLSELIQDVSLITKIEEAPSSFFLEAVSICKVLEGLKNDLEFALQEQKITLNWEIPDDTLVKSSYHLLYSIFRNLTDNVIRYAGSDVEILIRQYNADKNFYYFSFSDTGVGIENEEHLSRLFERFYRISEGRTRDSGGSGLGLSIVKNAITLHKGTITAKNRAGGGLEFLFKLPRF